MTQQDKAMENTKRTTLYMPSYFHKETNICFELESACKANKETNCWFLQHLDGNSLANYIKWQTGGDDEVVNTKFWEYIKATIPEINEKYYGPFPADILILELPDSSNKNRIAHILMDNALRVLGNYTGDDSYEDYDPDYGYCCLGFIEQLIGNDNPYYSELEKTLEERQD